VLSSGNLAALVPPLEAADDVAEVERVGGEVIELVFAS
jgi:hypothetical protein